MVRPARVDRLERVTDLVLVLLQTPVPLTLDAIAHEVPGYPDEVAARRQAFERDKRLLRDEGIPVRTERLSGREQYGYRIDRDAFYLPDLALEPDEQIALHLAVAGVHLGDPSGRDALLKLGATGLHEVRPIATLVPPEALIDLFEAVRTRAVATFDYRNVTRRVAPVGLWFRFGHWYLVAWDLDRQSVRTFRVDRMRSGVVQGTPGSAEVPPGIDVRAALPDRPWQLEGDEHALMRIRVDALEGPRVAEEVGHDKVDRRHDDGSVDLNLKVDSFAAIRSWVLGLLHHAEILEPREFREELIAWLTALATAPVPKVRRTAALVPSSSDGERALGEARGLPGRHTSERLRRLLAVVGWLAHVGEAPLSEVSLRFGMSERELVAELELAACCGVPPYTPDTLMEIEVSETSVRAFLPGDHALPRRLTAAEGFAVAASARLILAVPGSDNDPLRRALAKLDAALGSRGAVGIEVDAPQHLAVVRQAADFGEILEIDYLSASRDELSTRTVEPSQVTTVDGHWYLDAFCHRADDMRRFRVDRINAVRPIDAARTGAPRLVRSGEDAFLPGPGALEVHLHLGPGAQWVAESVPVRAVRRAPDGSATDVVLGVAGMAWFERLLLQLGHGSYVVSPPELTSLAAEAARRVLHVYQKDIE
ncbi:MAG TPA: WYL domain-containing protein [Acidimicrobiales bacterium]|nr:WYL domain-containing protein [Acidimicrobiales bacterium]